jgi:hypothetical protein
MQHPLRHVIQREVRNTSAAINRRGNNSRPRRLKFSGLMVIVMGWDLHPVEGRQRGDLRQQWDSVLIRKAKKPLRD